MEERKISENNSDNPSTFKRYINSLRNAPPKVTLLHLIFVTLSSRSLKIQLDLTGLEQGLTFFEFIYSQIASNRISSMMTCLSHHILTILMTKISRSSFFLIQLLKLNALPARIALIWSPTSPFR